MFFLLKKITRWLNILLNYYIYLYIYFLIRIMNFLSSKDFTSKDDDYLRVYDEVNAEGGETDEQHSDVENQKKNEVGRSSIVPKLTLT